MELITGFDLYNLQDEFYEVFPTEIKIIINQYTKELSKDSLYPFYIDLDYKSFGIEAHHISFMGYQAKGNKKYWGVVCQKLYQGIGNEGMVRRTLYCILSIASNHDIIGYSDLEFKSNKEKYYTSFSHYDRVLLKKIWNNCYKFLNLDETWMRVHGILVTRDPL